MQWLDMPPGAPMQVMQQSERALELEGPTAGARATSGLTAGIGVFLAGMGLRFLRLPIPGPFKLIPAVFAAVGTGMTAVGIGGATARCSVRVTPTASRGPGVTARCPGAPFSDVRAVEVERLVHHSSDSDGHHQTSWSSICVRVVTHEGRALAIDEHVLEAQAQIRKEQIDALLAGARRPGRRRAPRARR